MVFNAILNDISVIKNMLQVHSHYKYIFVLVLLLPIKAKHIM